MQASPYEAIVTSQPFKFIVGKTKTEFFLHAALVASQSKALDMMTNGQFTEKQQNYAILADDDARTVTAFAEFLYKEDYELPSDMLPVDSNAKALGHRANNTKGSHKEEWNRPTNQHWISFTRDPKYGYDKHTASSGEAVLNAGSLDTDYSEFFIAHAKVYIFADYYGPENLADLAMQKLHQALCGFRLSRERFNDVLALVRFCYDRPAPDKLKKLVVSYIAGIVDTEIAAACLKEILKEKGEFAADVAWLMARRLVRF
ncbi:hypothetical protein E4U55_004526 [Claviceps digitariae]|nr:hypothetical protein E4U55_004526 [Claviceps digitariae]